MKNKVDISILFFSFVIYIFIYFFIFGKSSRIVVWVLYYLYSQKLVWHAPFKVFHIILGFICTIKNLSAILFFFPVDW